jgi:hypothetical protein
VGAFVAVINFSDLIHLLSLDIELEVLGKFLDWELIYFAEYFL